MTTESTGFFQKDASFGGQKSTPVEREIISPSGTPSLINFGWFLNLVNLDEEEAPAEDQ